MPCRATARIEVPNYGHQGRGPRLVPGMTIAIEPMICQYDCKITQSKDGWTVKTKDGGLAAHFEHSNAILKDHTEIMTRFWDDPDFDRGRGCCPCAMCLFPSPFLLFVQL